VRDFQLTLLGTNAAFPAFGRITSCQILNYKDSLILIDCGEGCQIRLNEYKIRRNKIQYICISHLHGDHVYGLPGLLTSYNHKDRGKPLIVIGPLGIKKFILNLLENSYTHISYDLQFIELDHKGIEKVAQMGDISISAFPLDHRIPTYGYRFDECLLDYNIRKESIVRHSLNIEEIKRAKAGVDIVRENGNIRFSDVVVPKGKPRSYAYCSDTVYDPGLIKYIQKVDLLYHETTYMHDLAEQAKERKHSTSKEAALIAKGADVGRLITGHYSSRYRTVDELLHETREYFPNSEKGYDGAIFFLETKR